MSELFLIVTMAGERVAISSAHVDSVVEVQSIIPVPRSANPVLGLAPLASCRRPAGAVQRLGRAPLRGRVFIVIDSLAALGLGHADRSDVSDAIVVDAD